MTETYRPCETPHKGSGVHYSWTHRTIKRLVVRERIGVCQWASRASTRERPHRKATFSNSVREGSAAFQASRLVSSHMAAPWATAV